MIEKLLAANVLLAVLIVAAAGVMAHVRGDYTDHFNNVWAVFFGSLLVWIVAFALWVLFN
jgi:hypothetical protein